MRTGNRIDDNDDDEDLENGLNVWPGLRVAAGHKRGPVAGTVLAAGDARADVEDAALAQVARPPRRVGVLRVAAVDDDVALVQQRHQLLDELIHRIAGCANKHTRTHTKDPYR